MEHTFRASCRRTFRGVTCAETFEGAEGAVALAAHMEAAHRPRPSIGLKPAWINGNPRPHTAPKAPVDASGLAADASGLAAVLIAHADHVADVGTSGAVTEGDYRYDDVEPAAPLALLPARVRGILAGAVDRGERWVVRVTPGAVHVSVGRVEPRCEASFVVERGKVRRVNLRTSESGGSSVYGATISAVKAAFPDARPRR